MGMTNMGLRSTLALLAVSICFSFGLSAQAAEKSAISPDVAAPAIESVPAPEIALPSQPSSEPAVSIQAPSSSVSISAPASSQNSEPSQTVVEIKPRLSPSLSVKGSPRSKVVTTRSHSVSDRVDIVLESRSSGCRAVISGTSSLDGMCAPKAPISSRSYYTPSYAYVNAAGFSARVRPLSNAELKALSRPSNGDKQMQFPLAIPAEISSSFGYRVHPITGEARFHQGTDIAAAEGTPVLAAYSGTVEVSGWLGGLGLAVVISHGDRLETRYGHMSQLLVEPGQKIQQGMPIGLVGSTGFSTGPHLHFEMWQKLGEEWMAANPTEQLVIALERLNRYLAQITKPQSRT